MMGRMLQSTLSRLLRSWVGLLALAAIAVAPGTASAVNVGPQGIGGTPFAPLQCPNGMFMLGVALHTTPQNTVTAIRANCLAFNASTGQYVSPPQFTAFSSGLAGTLVQNGCSPDRYLSGIRFGLDMRGPAILSFVEMDCASISGSGPVVTVCLQAGKGCWQATNPPGITIAKSFQISCPAGQAAIGLIGTSSSGVNALGLICGLAPKQPPLAKLDAAFRGWMQKDGITVNAVLSNGVNSIQYGNRQSGTAYPIASLTKAITASCIATLVEQGKLAYTDTLEKRLQKVVDVHQLATHDLRAGQVTIAQLIRHVSGIRVDSVVPPWAAGITNTAAADQQFVAKALAVALGAAPGATPYFYNNVDYALLGMIIKEVTGQTYETYCKGAVLSPLGITDAQIGPGIPSMGAFGGWQISAASYANFISKTYRKMTPGREAFMQASFTAGDGGNGTAYGLGVALRKTSKGRNIWHFGNWPGGGLPAPPTTPSQFSSYFALWDTGDLVVVLMDKQLNTQQQDDLDAAFVSALGIKD